MIILCHACGQWFLSELQSAFQAARDHCLDNHLDEMAEHDIVFTNLLDLNGVC